METQILLQTITFAIIAGVMMQIVAEKAKLPSIVFLMAAGILLGPQFLNLVQPKVMGPGLEVLVSMAVALILFEGGLSLDFDSFKEVGQSVRNMLSFGLFVTILGSAVTMHYVLDVSWAMSLLFGSFMSITGLTVINPILRRVKIKKELATILRSEGILSNPLGAFISVGVLEVILASSQANLTMFAYQFFIKIIVGLTVGYTMGWFMGKAINRGIVSSDLKNLAVFAWVFASFYASNFVEPNTGILAVVVSGFAVQSQNIPQLAKLKKFKGQLSILFISILFILISANLDLSQIYKVGWMGILVVCILMFVVRPIAVMISNIGLLSLKDKVYVSWIGPKGIVSASVASLFSLILVKKGFDEALMVEAMVFLTIMVTVVLQGLSAKVTAKWLECLVEDGNIVIVGANALGRTLGTAFKEIGKDVVLVDSNIDHCKISEEDGLETVHGNCLDPEVLDNANIAAASTVIATTANSEANFLVCQLARDLYNIPEVYPTIDSPHKGVHEQLVGEIGGNLAYAKSVSIQDWKDAVDADGVKIVDVVLEGEKGKFSDFNLENKDPNDWIPLILKRKNGYFFVHADQEWTQGDILIYLSK